jgi:hypothetical protein
MFLLNLFHKIILFYLYLLQRLITFSYFLTLNRISIFWTIRTSLTNLYHNFIILISILFIILFLRILILIISFNFILKCFCYSFLHNIGHLPCDLINNLINYTIYNILYLTLDITITRSHFLFILLKDRLFFIYKYSNQVLNRKI